MNKTRILIVDDHQLVIDGLKAFFENSEEFQVIGEANNGEEAINCAQILGPEVILMDIDMPVLSGIQATQEIKRNLPEIKILIISMHDEKSLIKKLMEMGVDGYLLKNSSRNEVFDAIETVLKDEKYFSEDVLISVKGEKNKLYEKDEDDLTEREIEIIKLISQGMTNKDIGEELNISHRTVDTHRTNLMKKLEVTNVAGLIRYAYRNNLVD